jgi:hypothetical protein
MMLKTLADVRTLMKHLPADRRQRTTWRHVAAPLTEAAAGADPWPTLRLRCAWCCRWRYRVPSDYSPLSRLLLSLEVAA